MRSLRTLEARVLGYSIERVEELDHLGGPAATWYEVHCPYSNAILSTAATRADAERVVVARELEAARRAIVMNGGLAA